MTLAGLLARAGVAWLAAGSAQAADGIAGSWQGRYVCNQGETGLTLAVSAQRGPAITAVFSFHAVASNPGVPDGCFDMAGEYDANTGRVRLLAGQWLVQPFGYVTVDLTGVVDASRRTMSGTVEGPFCTRFELHRVRAAQAAVPAACTGLVAMAGP